MAKYNSDDTIVAIATPIGEGGIGIVRMSGERSLSIADKIFSAKDGKKPSEIESYTVKYGWIVNLLFERDEILSSRQARRIKFHRVEKYKGCYANHRRRIQVEAYRDA